ncbi:arginine--tRNA ligase [Spiribacter roseus]|jgi:arginyl-tRNA synthetase|uniref:arginine--tRNA ligase n=1 Tax=Spiribacter roseus TaxID=1855875 RepID=UPI000D8F8ABB|nr:arginine--tRNA ligase [Spiribacter roseus]KAF0283743.1 arginine--tRNA ligase [Spiribacter roseus]PZA00984.1 arginine--tRNA ligase [Gammaproteobacteria bacterium 2W06]
MKEELVDLLSQALQSLAAAESLSLPDRIDIQLERGRGSGHGDYASNLAMRLAPVLRQNPRELATRLVAHLPVHAHIDQVEVAGPGFINFFLTRDAANAVIARIHREGREFGRSHYGRGQQVIVEFVSANPTGPLHVGHGRGAAFGAALADVLEATGHAVHREYYINDAGRQMHILAVSVLIRYLEHRGESMAFPANGYRGDYIHGIARDLEAEAGERYRITAAELTAGLPADAHAGGDKEAYIDALIARARGLLGEGRYEEILEAAVTAITGDIAEDLAAFGVRYDRWFSERALVRTGAVEHALEQLQAAGALYDAEGARWFRSTDYGDDKDRVVRRADGQTTYFASDIAYHLNKFERGFEQAIDVFGADHHGYMARVRASLEAFGHATDALTFRLVQFAILYRGSERLPMSTRAGEFVTLRALREEVGNDAARFFYVMRRPEQHLDFDLELAKSQSNDNPVYYIQYAHARVCSVRRQRHERGIEHDHDNGLSHVDRLDADHEQALIQALGRYPEALESAAANHEPHLLAAYLRELAGAFHTYYNAHTFLVDDRDLRDARLTLIEAVRQVVRNGLDLLGVSAPERM